MIVQSSFEDFLYIILGLVWIIFSFYKAKKKKKEKEAPSQSGEKKSLVESLLNEMGLQDEEEEPHYVEPYQDTKKIEPEPNQVIDEKPEEVFSYDDYYEESNYNSKDDVIERKPVLPIKNIDKAYKISEKSSSTRKVGKNINLRKAVIYSEILKKVYF
tara:strand:+ start:951 stop:1424 length:474 start_codon:yes stop_codon:yes gene_type:complete